MVGGYEWSDLGLPGPRAFKRKRSISRSMGEGEKCMKDDCEVMVLRGCRWRYRDSRGCSRDS